MIDQKFHPRIGGDWETKVGASEAGKWHQKTYLIRNKIIHTGYKPKFSEAEIAISAAKCFGIYVVSLIKIKAKTYPDLARYLIP